MVTYGSIFSFMGATALSAWKDAVTFQEVNSQTMALLEAPRSIDPVAARGGGDITVVDGSALLPDYGPEGTIADIEETPRGNGQISVYVVREGDTLSGISRMFDVSVNTIFWANNIKSEKDIHPGNQLVILPVTGVQHTVAKGDTFESIAKKYKGDVADILAFNNLATNHVLSVGEAVLIPDGEKQTRIISKPASRWNSPSRPLQVVYKKVAPAGYYAHPVPGARKTQGLHGYNGVDFGAPVGTTVRAAAPGTVSIARNYGYNGGYGKYVVIQHANNTQTLYAHNSAILVTAGQLVAQGQPIARMGSTGHSTGPHLHFEVRGVKNPF